MKAKVIKTFIDKKANKERKKGSVFNVTQERFNEINGTVHGKLIEMVEEDVQDGESNRYNIKTDE